MALITSIPPRYSKNMKEKELYNMLEENFIPPRYGKTIHERTQKYFDFLVFQILIGTVRTDQNTFDRSFRERFHSS